MAYNLLAHRTVERHGDDLLIRLDGVPVFQLTRVELVTLVRLSRETQVDQHLTDVLEFQRQLGHAYEGPPRLPDEELALFRLRFLGEELRELGQAVGVEVTVRCEPKPGRSPVPIVTRLADALDGLVDLSYVLLGTVLQLGLGGAYQEAWRRVHAANLLKVAGHTKRGIGKDATKPSGWLPPDLSDLVVVTNREEETADADVG